MVELLHAIWETTKLFCLVFLAYGALTGRLIWVSKEKRHE